MGSSIRLAGLVTDATGYDDPCDLDSVDVPVGDNISLETSPKMKKTTLS